MKPEALYQLLRHLTLPIVAVTSSSEGRANGMIANSAQRASLVPSRPRLSLYVSKLNLTHDLVYASGVVGVHLLRPDQFELVRRLGLRTGRDGDKLEGLDVWRGETGCPMLHDVHSAFDCRVVNAMDAGAATFFLADVVEARGGDGHVMTSEDFRAHVPDGMRALYERRLIEAQAGLAPLADDVARDAAWPGPTKAP